MISVTYGKLIAVNRDQSDSFGDWVKQLREQKGLNQSQLADLMHYDRSEVSKVEAGLKEATTNFVVAFAAAVEADVREALIRAGYPVHDSSFNEVSDAKAALEIVRLLYAIDDDDERDAAIGDIRALLKARKARLEARQPKRGAGGTADRSKAPGRA